MTKLSHPRHGSLGFLPKKRANRQYDSPETWPKTEETKLLGFAGYKAGMTHVEALDKRAKGPSAGKKIMVPATILECPPLNVIGVKAYKKTTYGPQTLGEERIEKGPKNLSRKTTVKKKANEKKIDLEKASEIRIVVSTQPPFKKTPEIFEIAIGGPADKAYEFSKNILGKTISLKDVFQEGDYIDVIGITKGHGMTGQVKRWGTRIQLRKAHGKRRHVGSINAITPARVMWTSLQGGQYGYHKRTELNKAILKIGEEGKEVTPNGGLTNYGEVRGNYILLKGSVGGTKKRLLTFRFAIRPPKERPAPEVQKISTRTQQGRPKK